MHPPQANDDVFGVITVTKQVSKIMISMTWCTSLLFLLTAACSATCSAAVSSSVSAWWHAKAHKLHMAGMRICDLLLSLAWSCGCVLRHVGEARYIQFEHTYIHTAVRATVRYQFYYFSLCLLVWEAVQWRSTCRSTRIFSEGIGLHYSCCYCGHHHCHHFSTCEHSLTHAKK